MRLSIKRNEPALRYVLLTLVIFGSGCSQATDSGDSPPNGVENIAQHGPVDKLSPVTRRPNVLLISLDTVRADRLGCYGYLRPTTPVLDALAKRGARFAQCRTPATWTLPAHMSLLTSLLPGQHTVDNLNKVLPRRILTLTEVLQQAGYATAALVNNGQMRAHWGFDRGFDLWQEFEVDTPDAAAGPLTAAALTWLKQAPGDKPYFLFLHYYDAHDPYDAPPEFREKFAAELSGPQCRELCFAHRGPDQPPLEPAALEQLQRAYDADLAQLDHHLGRLLEAVDDNTLVIVFSDHGEAFKEHGWLLHGATLYEEEVHVPLLVRWPGQDSSQSARPLSVVEEAVTLLDVAPTIVAAAGLPLPLQFQGSDLQPAMFGKPLPPRVSLAESKAILEGRFTRSAVLYPLKGILSLGDGQFELFRLPDETKNLAASEPELAAVLRQRIDAWLQEESCWVLHAVGDQPLQVEVSLDAGSWGLFLPLGLEPERDELEVSPEGNKIRWNMAAAPAGHRKALWLEPADPQAQLRLHVTAAGEPVPQQVYVGTDQTPASALPVTLSPTLAAASPSLIPKFQAARPGLYVHRYQEPSAAPHPGTTAPLDAETIRQLKSLGYLK